MFCISAAISMVLCRWIAAAPSPYLALNSDASDGSFFRLRLPLWAAEVV